MDENRSKTQALESRIQELEDRVTVFEDNAFLQSLPGQLFVLRVFMEVAFRRQSFEERVALLQDIDRIAAEKWHEEFPLGSMSGIETITRLREPVDALVKYLRIIHEKIG